MLSDRWIMTSHCFILYLFVYFWSSAYFLIFTRRLHFFLHFINSTWYPLSIFKLGCLSFVDFHLSYFRIQILPPLTFYLFFKLLVLFCFVFCHKDIFNLYYYAYLITFTLLVSGCVQLLKRVSWNPSYKNIDHCSKFIIFILRIKIIGN